MRSLLSLVLIVAVLVSAGRSAEGQQSAKLPRIGLLTSGPASSPGNQRTRAAFLQGLEELGYVEGKNIIIEYRHANYKRKLLPQLAAELVRLKVDVIVPSGPTAVRRAMKATKTIPIVMPNGGSPVRLGFVKSLSRPGGNITGVAGVVKGIRAKRVELLKETFSGASRVVVLNPVRESRIKEYK